MPQALCYSTQHYYNLGTMCLKIKESKESSLYTLSFPKIEQKVVLEVKKKLVNNWHTCYTLVIQIFIDEVHDFPFCHLSPYAKSQIQDTFKSICLIKVGNMEAPRVILDILYEP